MAAIFFDIDGTIWDEKGVIPESTAGAVRRLKENGHLTFLCSGRMKSMVYDERLYALGMDGLVAGCGTYIEFRGEEIFCREMEPEFLAETVRRLQGYGFAVMVEDKELLFMDRGIRENPYGAFLIRELGDAAVRLEDSEGRWSGTKFTVLLCGHPYEEAEWELGADFEIMRHGDIVMELVPKGFSKATGIRQVCELLNVPHAQTYAIGDSVNDCAMLRYAAHGIAMGNATPAAKEAADYITDDLYSDGVYNAMKHFGLI